MGKLAILFFHKIIVNSYLRNVKNYGKENNIQKLALDVQELEEATQKEKVCLDVAISHIKS